MRIYSPYEHRTKFARFIFGAVLVLLVNGWVDYANHSLRSEHWTQTYDAVALDDYDTVYEWVAEDLFDVEDAIPEQEGDSDDTGKLVDIKIYAANKQIAVGPPEVHIGSNPACGYLAHLWDDLPVSVWDPPPNGYSK